MYQFLPYNNTFSITEPHYIAQPQLYLKGILYAQLFTMKVCIRGFRWHHWAMTQSMQFFLRPRKTQNGLSRGKTAATLMVTKQLKVGLSNTFANCTTVSSEFGWHQAKPNARYFLCYLMLNTLVLSKSLLSFYIKNNQYKVRHIPQAFITKPVLHW